MVVHPTIDPVAFAGKNNRFDPLIESWIWWLFFSSYRCNQTGHFARDCSSDSSQTICYNCNKTGWRNSTWIRKQSHRRIDFLGHISRDCDETRSSNFGGGGGGFRGGRGKLSFSPESWSSLIEFIGQVAVVVVEEVIVIDAPNQVISHVIAPNPIIVLVGKVAMVARSIKAMMMTMVIKILNDNKQTISLFILSWKQTEHKIKRFLFPFFSFYSRHIRRSFLFRLFVYLTKQDLVFSSFFFNIVNKNPSRKSKDQVRIIIG